MYFYHLMNKDFIITLLLLLSTLLVFIQVIRYLF